MIRKILKVLLTLVGAAIGVGIYALFRMIVLSSGLVPEGVEIPLTTDISAAALFGIIFGIIFFNLAPLLGKQSRKIASGIESDLQTVPADFIMSGAVGLILGLVVAYFISKVYELFQVPVLTPIITIITYLVCAYLGIVILSKKGNELSPANILKLREAKPKQKTQNPGSPKILDTSVIIDGRIADIMKSGFIEGDIIIPEFVLLELQHIADSADSLKRARGRRGLDVLNKLRTDYGVDIYDTKNEKGLDEIPEVDIKLLKLAQNMNGKVVTNDFNLNKVAAIKGVKVLNINELANMLKPVVLPGEDMNVFPVKEGKEESQAVAYLDDGTMIVIENGRKHIGKNVDVTVTSMLQTAAGRMIFAKPKD